VYFYFFTIGAVETGFKPVYLVNLKLAELRINHTFILPFNK